MGCGHGKSTAATNGLQNAKCYREINVSGDCAAKACYNVYRKPNQKHRSAVVFVAENGYKRDQPLFAQVFLSAPALCGVGSSL